ncbi:hypothetical protein AB7828_03415 [Tardiphaga sp. 215_C5_N2_1]|uniref:hypothetical protein n=1 Tax=Tardiphaga sp. 215_C5_N2_1 TaxID=3240774 RepID=UPI003F893003
MALQLLGRISKWGAVTFFGVFVSMVLIWEKCRHGSRHGDISARVLLRDPVGGGAGVWVIDREIPTIIIAAEPVTPVVAAGAELRIDYVVRRHRSCAVSIDRFIIDRFNTRYELEDLNVNAGLPLGEDRFVQPVKVPQGVEAGPAKYRTSSIYVCNPLQRLWPITGGTRDINFLVK